MEILNTFADDIAIAPLLILAAVALAAGFFDAIAGGGGLITVPALLLAGLPPVSAIATSKLQAIFGSAASTISFSRAGLINWRKIYPAVIFSCAGSIAGALAISNISPDALKNIMPWMLIAMALYFAFSKKMTDRSAEQRLSPMVYCFTIAVAIGFYDGIFGVGTGSFFLISLISLLGYGVTMATAHTKILNLATIFGALCIYLPQGFVYWRVGIAMGIASYIGSKIGSKVAISNGARIIRPMLVMVCLLMAVKILSDPSLYFYQFF